ncbi:MAG: leucyl aminopeptidase [Phycisphaerae bacterium]
MANLGVKMAKEMIKIDVKAQKADAAKIKTDVLAIGVFSDVKNSAALDSLDRKLNGAISRLKKIGDFKAALGSSVFIYTNGKISAERILLIGFGEQKKASMDTFRQTAAKAAFEAVNVKAKKLAVLLHYDEKDTNFEKLGQTITEAIHFGGYRYNEFMTQKTDEKITSLSAVIIKDNQSVVNKISKGVQVGQVIGQAQNFARTLCNRPGSVLYPAELAAIAKKISAATKGLSCTIFDDKKLAAKKMGGILGVGQGSIHKPRMIIIKYAPRGAKNKEPIALVGKAITFDTGGISLKPAADMHEMKYDMTGGAAVLMTMQTIAKLKLPVAVYGIICAAENRPDGGSYLPGDILTTYSGKTVEVLNTDAEGRLVLCDGLEQAKVLKCKTAIDLATLTGACVVALGKHKAGLFSNDDKLAEKIKSAAKETSEPVWPLPYEQVYIDEMKGTISDLKNIASRWGGSCTGAAFIGEFAKGMAWAHLDIAPVSDTSDPMKKYAQSGSIGFGIRLLTEFLRNIK